MRQRVSPSSGQIISRRKSFPPRRLRSTIARSPSRCASSSIGLANNATIDMPDHPILDCAFALTFTEFAQDLMAPLATAMLGSGIVALATGGYRCSSPIRLPSGNPNPHAKGIAIDLSAITLADRRRIAIGHEANSAEALFARTMRQAACGWFTTVLGPGTDPAHAEHFHLDVLRHGASDDAGVRMRVALDRKHAKGRWRCRAPRGHAARFLWSRRRRRQRSAHDRRRRDGLTSTVVEPCDKAR